MDSKVRSPGREGLIRQDLVPLISSPLYNSDSSRRDRLAAFLSATKLFPGHVDPLVHCDSNFTGSPRHALIGLLSAAENIRAAGATSEVVPAQKDPCKQDESYQQFHIPMPPALRRSPAQLHGRPKHSASVPPKISIRFRQQTGKSIKRTTPGRRRPGTTRLLGRDDYSFRAGCSNQDGGEEFDGFIDQATPSPCRKGTVET